MTVNEAFLKYKKRLEITKGEQDDASSRQQEVRSCMKAAFDVKTDFLTGSYARHTKTKPLRDVDVFVVFGSDEAGRRQDPPQETLTAVENCLVNVYGRSSVVNDRRCVTVLFDQSTGSQDDRVLSIDVVPAFETKSYYSIPDGKLGNWINTDPQVHAESATAKNAELDGNWVPLVKMVKGWNRNAGCPIVPSFLIEVMALELVDAPFNAYPDEVRRFFAAAACSIAQVWPDPAHLGPDVSDEMSDAACRAARDALRQAEIQAANAFRADQQGRTSEALSIWRSVFGDLFPKS
ncbi:MAG: nucleotidyltransferase [Candidatus Eremiobacteraeota bacterium]|nr:nucleotidyltransferase [Candidatus Eremiobacteraeota bacterium]